jgi:hypothetical protein
MAVLQSTDDTYNIKYVLGGTEKNVPREFISCIDLNGVKVPRKAATANKENNSNTSNIGGSSKDSGGGAATMAAKAAKQAPAAAAVPAKKTAVDTKATATSSSTTTASTTTASTKRKGLAAPSVNTAIKGSSAASSTSAVEDKTASGVPTDAKRPKVTGNKVNSSNNNNNKSMKAKAVSDKVTTTAATAKVPKQSVTGGSSSNSGSHQAARVHQKAAVKQSVAVPVAPKAAAAAVKPVLDIDSERGGVFCSALVSYFEFETDGSAKISQILQGVNSRCDDDKQANFTEVEVKQLLKQLDAQGKVLIETYKGNDDLIVHQI